MLKETRRDILALTVSFRVHRVKKNGLGVAFIKDKTWKTFIDR